MISPDVYRERAARFARDVQQTEASIKQHAWIRLVLGVVMALIIYAGMSQSFWFYFLPMALTMFIILVRRQIALEDQKQQLSHLHTLNVQEEKALTYENIGFADGRRFIDPHHSFSHDLDLFGSRSVFEFINRCATQVGEQKLAADLVALSEQPLTRETLTERQEAVRDLSKLIEFRQRAWAIGKQIGDIPFNTHALTHWLQTKDFVRTNRWLTITRYVLPALTLASIVLAFFDSSKIMFTFLLMALQMGIVARFSKQIKAIELQLSQSNKILNNYSRLLELLSREKVESSLMKKHHALATEGFAHIKTFSGLVNAFESRLNPIALFFGNSLFQYDLHAVAKLEAWRSEHGNQVPKWLNSLAEWDALLSPATLHYNFPEYAFAEVSETNSLEATQAGHLLIPYAERVNNTIALGKPASVWLITGANMAGKSTFLRALGVNFVLGNIGSPVCATHWRMPLITLRTGMRTTDSLQDHQSYFFAELNRLQSIMQELRSGKPMFILLDEILKGTNSTDKQLGSRELLKQLKELNTLVVLATHDIALGDLEQHYPQQVANACFEGKITNDDLTFDYTLHLGVAQKANATFLMRKMGIIP